MVGQTLSHYRILEQIGAGGMGVVYLAHDEQLDRHVALKVLPAKTIASESARHRLRKEALSLARLNHPNVAIVHEFGSHNGVDFLVTEYIPGRTLDAQLQAEERGGLQEAEIIRLGIQLSQGLEAAHEQGVIHRDLKPANLRLTPSGRLKILDFGIAELADPQRETVATASLAESQQITGTLPYMAPEQLRGEKVDARADIWATGAVLYEMAVGRPPFPQKTAPLLINAIFNENPESPGKLNPRISAGLESVILKALEKNPERRYSSATELRADLERLTTGVMPVAARTRRWQLLAAMLGIAILIAGAWYLVKQRTRPRVDSAVSTAATRRSVAVLGFKNLTGRPDVEWLSTALSEMLTTELAAGGAVRTVAGENVARMKVDLAIPDADSYAPETLARIRKILAAKYVILGSYLDLGKPSGGQVRLDLRVQDTEAGQTLASLSVKGTEDKLDELASRAGADLREKLGVQTLTAAEASRAQAALPSNPEAARLYAEGLAKLRLFDTKAARELLERAVAADPSCPVTHAALAAALRDLGYDQKAKLEAKKAFDVSAMLPREERLWVEARYRETTNDWNKAIEIYRTLFNFFPDNLDYGLQLAQNQSNAGKGQEARATVALLRKLPAPQGEDPRIDMAEAQAARVLGDFKKMEASAARAAAKGQAQGSHLLVAWANTDQCVALRNIGDPKKAAAACDEAQRIYDAAGNQGGRAMALNNLANSLYDQGDLSGAKKIYEEVAASNRQIGNSRGVAGALDNLASLIGDKGDPAGARKLSEQALAIYRELDDYRGMGETLNNIAAEQVSQGDFKGATKSLEQSLAIWREKGDKTGTATVLDNLGEILAGQGELDQAKSKFEESLATFRDTGQKGKSAYPLFGLAQVRMAQGELTAAQAEYEDTLALSRETGDKHESAYALFGLGSVLVLKADLAGARKHHESALALRQEIGEKGAEAESRLALAELALEEGRAADADAFARAALNEFRKEKSSDDEIWGRAVLARVLLAQGKAPEAQKEIDGARKLKSQDRLAALRLTLADARVRAAAGRPLEAVTNLQAALAQATKYGYLGEQFEARLALGEVEVKSGKGNAGRARLDVLEKDATAKGFVLVAKKAAAARASK